MYFFNYRRTFDEYIAAIGVNTIAQIRCISCDNTTRQIQLAVCAYENTTAVVRCSIARNDTTGHNSGTL